MKEYTILRIFLWAAIHTAGPDRPVPLLREHRLYQADWLLRFYRFDADEIVDSENPNL